MTKTAESLVQLLRKAGYKRQVHVDSIAYLSQVNETLADVLLFLSQYKFTDGNFLDSDEVELYENYVKLNGPAKAVDLYKIVADDRNGFNNSEALESLEDETSVQEEINDLQDQLKTMEQLYETLRRNNSALEESISDLESEHKIVQACLKKSQSQETELDLEISALSKQLDLIKLENLKLLKKTYDPSPDVHWINQHLNADELILESLQEFYNESSTSSLLKDEYIREAEHLHQKWQHIKMEQISENMDSLKCKIRASKADLIMKEISEIEPQTHNLTREIEIAFGEIQQFQSEIEQIMNNLMKPVIEELANFEVKDRFMESVAIIRNEEYQMLQKRLDEVLKVLKCIISNTSSACFAALQEHGRIRDLYIATKTMQELIEKLSSFKMEKKTSVQTIQKQDKLLWLIKELSGSESQLCSLESLKQDLKNLFNVEENEFDRTQYQTALESYNSQIAMVINDMMDGAAAMHTELVLSPKSLLDKQEQVKQAANELKQKVASISNIS